MQLQKYRIHCWSDMLGKFAPSAWPLFDSPTEARTFGTANIKSLEFIVEAE